MIPTEAFGSTGQVSTRTIFGGAALGRATDEEAAPVLEVLLRYGVNHIDTAPRYGRSERRVGAWMDRHRKDFFLATKTDERTHQKARDQFHHSLERLRTDHVDLLQLHNLIDPNDWETVMGLGGALEAAVEAREQDLVRFIGVTGHGITAARMHLRSLERFAFDSVLLPCNFVMMQNQAYAADFDELVQACRARAVAVQTIKALTLRPWEEKSPSRNTWYQPLEDQADIDRAVHWVLGGSGVFLNTVADIGLLPRVLDAASRFQSAPSEEEMRDMAARRGMAPLFT